MQLIHKLMNLHKSRLSFPGCTIKGGFVTLYPDHQHSYEFYFMELWVSEVIDAEFNEGVLCVTAFINGLYYRLRCTFNESFTDYQQEIKTVQMSETYDVTTDLQANPATGRIVITKRPEGLHLQTDSGVVVELLKENDYWTLRAYPTKSDLPIIYQRMR
jgi:hypothetical protein